MKRTGDPVARPTSTPASLTAWLGLGLLLSACHSASPPQLTGHQGGLLPGMVLPEPAKPPSTAAQGYTGTTDQVLPDGHVLRREIYNGLLISQTWLSSLGRPERQVFYQGGTTPAAEVDFGPDGQRVQQTTFFSGTVQPMRVDEFVGGNRVVRFTVYWPSGRPRILSEADVSTPAGLVNRVRTWYENGRPKSLVQKAVQRDDTGRSVSEYLQGRQTEWNEEGMVVSDAEYDHDTLTQNFLVEAKK